MSSPGDRSYVNLTQLNMIQGNETMFGYSPALADDVRWTPALLVPYIQQFIPQGEPGPQGNQGIQGVPGAQGPASIEVVFDGGGADIPVNTKVDIEVPFNATITAARLFADAAGSIEVGVWKDTYANFPPTAADSITASTKPTLSAANKSQDTTLSGWTTILAIGDILRFNIDSCSGISRITLSLDVDRT